MCVPGAGRVQHLQRLPQELATSVNSYVKEHASLKVQCLLAGQEFSSMAATESHAAAKLEVISKDSYGSFTHCAYSMSGEGAGASLYSLQQGAHVILFSGEQGGFFGRAMRIVEMLRPGVIAPFTESAKIRSILAEFERKAYMTLKHKKSVRKGAIGAMPKTALEWDRAAGDRRYESVNRAFASADKSDLVIDSLRAFTGENGGLDITVSRKGLITVHKGGIEDVYDNVLRPIMDNGMDMRRRFSRRSRSERPDGDPRPLLVQYKRGVFAGDAGRRRFCELIGSYARCNYAIVCAGNPHIYISVLDRTDNSSIAVRSVGDSALAIIPQIRTSAESLLRLTAFMASSFCEGVIGEYEGIGRHGDRRGPSELAGGAAMAPT